MIVFEFFSGIGGMHQSLKNITELNIKNIFPFDINQNANKCYNYNFGIKPFELSIESLSLEDYEQLCIKENIQFDHVKNLIWVMSPPCQPFTRQGNEKDLDDKRTMGFVHLIEILKKTKFSPNFILLENNSDACNLFKNSLKEKSYMVNEFLLSPNQLGVPNSRLRYYLLARDSSSQNFPLINCIDTTNIVNYSEMFINCNILNNNELSPTNIKDFLNFKFDDETNKQSFYANEKILCKESSNSIDIVSLQSNNSCCFTKSYGKLLKGSGSFLLIDHNMLKPDNKLIELLGKLRYFTPDEIMKLMCFNQNFVFPAEVSVKTRYKLLGNSINVKVVTILLKYLLFC